MSDEADGTVFLLDPATPSAAILQESLDKLPGPVPSAGFVPQLDFLDMLLPVVATHLTPKGVGDPAGRGVQALRALATYAGCCGERTVAALVRAGLVQPLLGVATAAKMDGATLEEAIVTLQVRRAPRAWGRLCFLARPPSKVPSLAQGTSGQSAFGRFFFRSSSVLPSFFLSSVLLLFLLLLLFCLQNAWPARSASSAAAGAGAGRGDDRDGAREGEGGEEGGEGGEGGGSAGREEEGGGGRRARARARGRRDPRHAHGHGLPEGSVRQSDVV